MFCTEILGPLWVSINCFRIFYALLFGSYIFLFQPENGFWNSDHPQLTSCFQKTILIWIPRGLLFVFLLFYFFCNRTNSKNIDFSKCKFCACKLVSNICAFAIIKTSRAQIRTRGKFRSLRNISGNFGTFVFRRALVFWF